MYICAECGATFNTPQTHLEPKALGAFVVFERWLVCPRCTGGIEEWSATDGESDDGDSRDGL